MAADAAITVLTAWEPKLIITANFRGSIVNVRIDQSSAGMQPMQ
jgi:hypothetical protein